MYLAFTSLFINEDLILCRLLLLKSIASYYHDVKATTSGQSPDVPDYKEPCFFCLMQEPCTCSLGYNVMHVVCT